jgi:hypothetical protein
MLTVNPDERISIDEVIATPIIKKAWTWLMNTPDFKDECTQSMIQESKQM